MQEHEKEMSFFKEMVDANEKTAKRWQLALIISNALWAVIVLVFILLWFFTPYEVDFEQNQEQPDQQQGQEYAQRG
jgi:flagellar biosynthesis/type III secretory pathway M-ring protein FliF/YscJ